MKTVLKVLTALAAIAGTVYVIATYGDKIVAWAKKILSKFPSCSVECECSCECGDECEDACTCECTEEAPAEEPASEEAPVEEVAEEVPVEEIVIEENDPVADEEDFAE